MYIGMVSSTVHCIIQNTCTLEWLSTVHVHVTSESMQYSIDIVLITRPFILLSILF